MRSAKIDEAEKLTVAEAQDVVKASGAQTVDEVLAAYKAENEAEKAERRKRIKPLTSAQADEILKYHPIDGASIADWFKRWKTNDLNRIAQAVQRGAIEELSVDEVAANVWNACNVSRNSARTVARTIINGVSNAARAETLFANEDAIDGIEFLATLDARTSHICGALDGTVQCGDEMKRARRPPLHPNCRSTLIPVVDLVDPKTGEKIEETAERPAQNADGTYSQVAAKTTFKDYFESQPETFQREWLGEKRFELWKSGKLKFEDLAKPATTYRATPADLTPPTEKPKETAVSDDKTSNAPALPPLSGLPQDVEKATLARQKAVDALTEKRAVESAQNAFDELRTSLKQANDDAAREQLADFEAVLQEAGGDAKAAATFGRELLRESRELAARWNAADDWLDDEEGDVDLIARAALKYRRGDADRLAFVLARLTKEPFTPSKPIENAADFTDVLREFRVWKYGEKRAEAKFKDADKYAADRKEFQKYKLSDYFKDLDKKIADAFNSARLLEPGTPERQRLVAEYHALEAEKAKAKKRAQELPQDIEADAARRISGTANADATHLLSVLFPDRGGDEFFDASKILEVEKNFEAESDKLKGVPTRVFSRYNIIARYLKKSPAAMWESINFTDAKTLGALGDYHPITRKIRLLEKKDKETTEQTFAHELGHWFEQQLLDPDASEAAIAWIIKEGGSRKRVFRDKDDPLELKKSPHLLWSYWGYSAKVYSPNYYNVQQPPPFKSLRQYKISEIFSTGFEALLTDPEAFALAAPEHFNYIIEAIRKVKVN